ncbi:hypothetical protein GCM10009678_88150 [Actinomadura kijaniata]|uniref:Uncharacterized protein n=1 Tax=Actinomadura namibiensis TaxID=182080 RepID=A0A7W3QNQ0_ACTNM|nr:MULTISPECIES: hypothetical protein [Actinomadura]MBA8953832.1 hypothetical protein [Actinomadura namibiensis]
MNPEPHPDDEATPSRWRSLPPRTPLEDLEAGHEVPPAPQAIAEGGITPLEEATRYPA